jgi:hypothetical protein
MSFNILYLKVLICFLDNHAVNCKLQRNDKFVIILLPDCYQKKKNTFLLAGIIHEILTNHLLSNLNSFPIFEIPLHRR